MSLGDNNNNSEHTVWIWPKLGLGNPYPGNFIPTSTEDSSNRLTQQRTGQTNMLQSKFRNIDKF